MRAMDVRAWRLRAAAVVALALALAVGLAGTGADLAGASHPEGEGKDNRRATQGAGNPDAEPGTSFGTRVVGHADPGGGFHADVFAYANHAYLGSWGAGAARCPSYGVRVFDLADPSDPQHVSTFADGASEPELEGTWTEKVVVDRFRGQDLAAVSMQRCRAPGFRGFGIYDVTDPANPERLALVPTAANGSHEIWLETRRGAAYVYTAVINAELQTGGDEADFQIWDVSDPTGPEKVGQWGVWADLGIPPNQPDELGRSRSRFVHSVIGAVSGAQHYAYLSYWDFGTVILDVTDPANPRFVGRTEFAPEHEGNAHSAWLAKGGNVLIQTDEDFNPNARQGFEGAWGYPRIFDISDPANPEEIATFELPTTRDPNPDRPGDFTVHDPKIRGNKLYLSWYAEGVVVLDISRPADPQMIGQFLPPPAEDPFGFFTPAQVNVWGVDLQRNYAVASDTSSGLWVFELDRASARGRN